MSRFWQLTLGSENLVWGHHHKENFVGHLETLLQHDVYLVTKFC
jgi:hypothetical protein